LKKILSINKKEFELYLPKEWKEVFEKEYEQFGKLWELYGLFLNNKMVWGLWIWYNPDHFSKKENIEYINNLHKRNYKKISYFYIKEEFKWNRIGEIFLKTILNNKQKYFLTCTNERLKNYYISVWFDDFIYEEGKFIILYDNK